MPERSIGTSVCILYDADGNYYKFSLTKFVNNYMLNYSYKIQRSVANKHLSLKNFQFIVISHVTQLINSVHCISCASKL
jgi:hypothetical protein